MSQSARAEKGWPGLLSSLRRREVLGTFAGILVSRAAAAEQTVLVAAAADLKFAFDELRQQFQQATGIEVKVSYGSSGNFARQIRQGAGFELFLSADEQYVLGLAREGLARDEGALYAVGRLALVAHETSPIKVDPELADVQAAMSDGRLRRFSIANPEHAPYGARAREALQHRGLWDAIQPYLVLGENVAQAAQYVTSAAAEAGLVALSLALAPTLAVKLRHALVPAEWHSPLRQRMALLRPAGASAERLYAWLQTAEARAIFARYGFVLPG